VVRSPGSTHTQRRLHTILPNITLLDTTLLNTIQLNSVQFNRRQPTREVT